MKHIWIFNFLLLLGGLYTDMSAISVKTSDFPPGADRTSRTEEIKVPSASLHLSIGSKSAGIKISKLKNGDYAITAREMGGSKLLAISVKADKAESSVAKMTVKNENGSSFNTSLRIGSDGNITCSPKWKDVKLGRTRYDQTKDEPNAQSWLADVFKDVAAVIVSVVNGLMGHESAIPLTNGKWVVSGSGGGSTTLSISNGEGQGGNFKLEPGLEGDPGIWY